MAMATLTTENFLLRAWKKACGLPPGCETILIHMPLEDVASASYEDPDNPGVWHKCAVNSIDIEVSNGELRLVGQRSLASTD